VETATTNGDQQGTTSSPDEEANTTLIESETATDEETDATIVDEVLLSTAVSVTVTSPTEMITTVGLTGEELTAEPITVMPQTKQTEPVPTGESATAPQWIDELTAPTTTEPILSGTTAANNSTFITDTMVAVIEETAATAEQGAGESQVALPAAPIVEPVVTQAAAADSKVPTTTDSADETAEETSVLEIDLQVPELAAKEAMQTTSESDGKTSEVSIKTPEATTPTTPTNTGPITTQPTTSWHGANSAPVTKQDSDPTLPTIDRARFVQRVANAFRSAQNNEGHIQLRLSPPELGSLRIEIAVRNGVLSANLEAETADARRVLLDNLPALRQRLAEQDIRIDKFEVDIRREGGQPDGQANAREQQTEQQSQRGVAQNRIRTQSTNSEILTTRVARYSGNATDAGLDVRI
jgi:flagellar hook-length control protein FliK